MLPHPEIQNPEAPVLRSAFDEGGPAPDSPPRIVDSSSPDTPNHGPPVLRSAFDEGGRRHTGKIAQLPKELRLLVNQLLDDGATYSAIIKKLGERGVSLNHENISNWRSGGHQDWLREQEALGQARAETEFVLELFQETDAAKLQQALLQFAAMRVFKLLQTLDAPAFKAAAEAHPENYTRLFAAISRISRESLRFQKYRDAAVGAIQGKCPNSSDEVTEEQRQMILDVADDILGAKAYRRRRPPERKPPGLRESNPDQSPATTPPDRAPPAAPTVGQCVSPVLIPPTAPPEPPVDRDSASRTTPDDQSAPPAPVPPVAPPEPLVEFCRGCDAPLPPLLPSGERPNEHCRKCGTPAPPLPPPKPPNSP